MPERREGKLAEPFSFALLVYACQRVERTSVLNIIFPPGHFNFFRTRGRCFRGICKIGGGAIGGFTPLGRGGKRDAPFYFALPPFKFNGSGERGGAGSGGSIVSAAALLVYACQRVGGRAY